MLRKMFHNIFVKENKVNCVTTGSNVYSLGCEVSVETQEG